MRGKRSTRSRIRRVQGEGKVEAQPRAAAGRAMPAAARRQERAAAMSRLPLRAAAALPGYGRGAAPPQVPGRVRGCAGPRPQRCRRSGAPGGAGGAGAGPSAPAGTREPPPGPLRDPPPAPPPAAHPRACAAGPGASGGARRGHFAPSEGSVRGPWARVTLSGHTWGTARPRSRAPHGPEHRSSNRPSCVATPVELLLRSAQRSAPRLPSELCVPGSNALGDLWICRQFEEIPRKTLNAAIAEASFP